MGQALASLRRVARLVSMSSRTEGGRTYRTEFLRGMRGGEGGGEQDKQWDNSDSVRLLVKPGGEEEDGEGGG